MSDQPPRGPKPFVYELEDGAEADPGLVPPVPETGFAAEVEAATRRQAAAIAKHRRSPLGRFALWSFGALFTFVLSVAAYDFTRSLFARNDVLGTIALILIALACLAALGLALREAAGFFRLARLDALRLQSATALGGATLAEADAVGAGVLALYRARADTAWAARRYLEQRPDLMDGDAVLSLAELTLLAPLDARVRAEIEASARRVAAVTALVPVALADVAAALYSNMVMIRRIAEIYGGRAGALGSLSLLRKVFSALLATGAVALADDLVGSVAGGGVLSKISRRFGEGVVNAALTARIGIAAMELCRPMPFVQLERPKVGQLVSGAVTGLMPKGAARD